MTGLTTLTSERLHQLSHPLAFSFSTHHFPLLCNGETMTTSESQGWSNMKAGEGFEPTGMRLALLLHKLSPSPVLPLPVLLLWTFLSFILLPSQQLFYFLFGEPMWVCLKPSFSLSSLCFVEQKNNYSTIYVAFLYTNTPFDVWKHAHMSDSVLHLIVAPELRPSSRPLRPTLTSTITQIFKHVPLFCLIIITPDFLNPL